MTQENGLAGEPAQGDPGVWLVQGRGHDPRSLKKEEEGVHRALRVSSLSGVCGSDGAGWGASDAAPAGGRLA